MTAQLTIDRLRAAFGAAAHGVSECNPTDFACVTAGSMGRSRWVECYRSLDLDTIGTSTAAMSLISADPAVLKAAGTEVVGVAPGVAALVMIAENAADFLHVFVVEPNRIGHRFDDGVSIAVVVSP